MRWLLLSRIHSSEPARSTSVSFPLPQQGSPETQDQTVQSLSSFAPHVPQRTIHASVCEGTYRRKQTHLTFFPAPPRVRGARQPRTKAMPRAEFPSRSNLLSSTPLLSSDPPFWEIIGTAGCCRYSEQRERRLWGPCRLWGCGNYKLLKAISRMSCLERKRNKNKSQVHFIKYSQFAQKREKP